MTPSNIDRAAWAEVALEAFAAETGQDRSGDLEHDTESVVSDLICDLMHLCNRRGIDFKKALRCAKFNYIEELDEDGSEAEMAEEADEDDEDGD